MCLLSNIQLSHCDSLLLESKVHTYIHKLAASGDISRIKELLAENPALVRYMQSSVFSPVIYPELARIFLMLD